MTSWKKCISLEEHRKDFGCVLIDAHRIIVCGGKHKGRALKSCTLWDCESNTSTPLTALPIEMPFCRAVCLKGHVYVLGSHMEFYSLDIHNMEKGWKEQTNTISPGIGFALVASKTHVYQIGGFLIPTQVSRYNHSSSAWEQLADLPTGRRDHQACLIDDKIYVMGGRTTPDDQVIKSVDIYHEDEGWMSGPDLPKGLMNHAATITNDSNIIVTGGQSSCRSSPLSTTYLLDTKDKGAAAATTTWTALGHNLPQSLSGHASVSTQFKVYILGGVHDTEDKVHSDSVYSIDSSLLNRSTFGAMRMSRSEQVDDDSAPMKFFLCC